ncbi:MAG TPA: response regulator [Ktedonobacterales bacterium]|nr:response regulator [Ktedonobacterales bacterium]
MADQIGDGASPSSRGQWKVLLVDDVQDLRDAIRYLLEGEGYEVLEAADGKAALAILRASRYPLVVLLDMMMPLMQGDSVIETLIKERVLPGKHAIVLLTASPATVPRTLHSQLTKYGIPVVSKTVPPEEILDKVERASERITFHQSQPW